MQSNPEPLRGDGRGSNLANRGKDEMSKCYMRGESFIQTGRLLNISILYQHHKFMLQKVSSFLFSQSDIFSEQKCSFGKAFHTEYKSHSTRTACFP